MLGGIVDDLRFAGIHASFSQIVLDQWQVRSVNGT